MRLIEIINKNLDTTNQYENTPQPPIRDKNPLSNQTFVDEMEELDDRAYDRQNFISKQLGWMNLWLFIIAFYFFIQIIKEIIAIIFLYQAGATMVDLIQLFS